MKRSPLALVSVLVSAIAVSTAFAAAPKIVLQKSDFAPAAQARILQSGAAGKGGFANYAYRTAGKPNELSSSVAVLPSLGLAKAFFAELKSDALSLPPTKRLQLPKPRYGDEQFAHFSFLGGSELIVRKGSVVWVLGLQTFLTRGGQTHELTKAEAIAEYTRYGRKQQRRVGNS